MRCHSIAFNAGPLLDDEGVPVGTVIEARNIAEEKARDAALRELTERLEQRVAEEVVEREPQPPSRQRRPSPK